MDWRSGSSGREPSLQAGSPKLKPQSHQKKTNKIKNICMYISKPGYYSVVPIKMPSLG
jgi:hypothetical protein